VELVEKRFAELEKRVAALEEKAQRQPKLKLSNDYRINFGRPKLLKPKLTKRLLDYFK